MFRSKCSGFISVFVCGLCLFFSNQSKAEGIDYNQLKISDTYYHTEINKIYNLISSNVSTAKDRIDELNQLAREYRDTSLQIEVAILEMGLYHTSGDFVRVKMELYEALGLVNAKTSLRHKLFLDYFKGILHHFNGEYKLSTDLLKQTHAIACTNRFKYLEGLCLFSIGRGYLNLDKYELGYTYLNRSVKLFESINEMNFSMLSRIRIGSGKVEEKKFSEAYQIFYSCLSQPYSDALKSNYNYLILIIADCHLENNQLDSAKYYFDLFSVVSNHADLRDVYCYYEVLGEYYMKSKQYDSAYYYSKKLLIIDDSLDNLLQKDLGDKFQKKYEKKQHELILKEKNSQIIAMRSSNNFILLVLVIGGILLTVVVVIVGSAYSSKNQLNKRLIEQQKSIVEKNEMIDAALKEKVILLKEIHHRVKNNLQIISSLLNLQARNVTDESALNALKEGKERIQAIALIHQRLYQNDSFTTIDMEGYVDDLILQLSRTYVLENTSLNILVKSENIQLNLDTAIPLGLILCELVTNVMKHAFIDREKGEMTVLIQPQDGKDQFLLSVKDNGNGICKGKDHATRDGLGSEIVEALTEQLEGEMEVISNKEGTEIRILFQELVD